MRLEFEDLTEFFLHPPQLSQMAKETRDGRKGDNEVAIIVPSYHDNFRLGKLLRYLKKQKFKKFDLVIVLAGDDAFVKEDGLSIFQIKRKGDFGFAGSVYLGQLFALKEGYEYYMFTDVDRVPHEEGVLGLLYRTAQRTGADYVFGNNLVKGYFFDSAGFFDFHNPKAVRSNCVFGLIRTSTLKKTGLYALPLYIGYEDVEFEQRLLRASRLSVYLDRTIYESYNSPAKSSFLKNFGSDSTGYMYVYPTLLCIYHCPQSANHLGFARKARMFFMVLFSQKYSALRVPQLAQYERNARKMVFAKTRASGVSGEREVSVSPKKLPQDYGTYTSNAPSSNFSRIVRCLFFPSEKYVTGNYTPLFDFFIHDSFFVHDERVGKTLFFEWARKPSVTSRLGALFSALADTALALFTSECAKLTGDCGIFNRYGIARAARE